MTFSIRREDGEVLTHEARAETMQQVQDWLEDHLSHRGFEVNEVETGVLLASQKRRIKGGKVRLVEELLIIKEVF